MDDNFYRDLFCKRHNVGSLPSNAVIAEWALNVIHLMYPEQNTHAVTSVDGLRARAQALENELAILVDSNDHFPKDLTVQIAADFFSELPEIYRILNTDIQSIYDGDPAAVSEHEVIRTYPGFYAISFYRLAHQLHNLRVPLVPRILTEHAHAKTGIDIHPAAVIGEYFHIDHGTGVVIGETCNIGRHVKLYQGVTLGALSVRKELAGSKRHPTIGDRVIIYSGATILGGDTVIGHDSILGGNVWLTQSVAPHSKVFHSPMISVQNMIEEI